MDLYDEFAKYLQGKDLDQLLRDAKTTSADLLTDQGIVELAVVLADKLAEGLSRHPNVKIEEAKHRVSLS